MRLNVGQASRLPVEFGHFLPVSRSETTMVAVGLSPRTESKRSIRRRVATAELSTGTGVFNRRSATRANVVSSPWTEVHGYLHGLAPRGPGRRPACPASRWGLIRTSGFVPPH